MRNRIIVAVAVAASAVLLSACEPDDGTGPVVVTSHSGAPTTTTTGAAPATGPYTVTSKHLEGPNYKIDVPQVDGGAPAARSEFDTAMAALGDTDARMAKPGDVQGPGATGTTVNSFTDTAAAHSSDHVGSRVVVGTHVLSGVLAVSVYGGGAAHPFTQEDTHVTDIDTGRALTLADVFTDEQQGLRVLSQQAAILVPQTNAQNNFPQESIAPEEKNFGHWNATAAGMQILFGEIASHAAGQIVITVPWKSLDQVLKPEMRTTLEDFA